MLKTDPTLAFRLMRYINSPAFGLSVEINSFRHAIMVLGYNRLKRWLALLLASASKDPNVKPVMYAAVRRGLLMEELGLHGASSDQRSEMFICGVFSLLDRLMGQPLPELMRSIPVPDAVRAALVEQSGPYHAQLELVRAVEAESRVRHPCRCRGHDAQVARGQSCECCGRWPVRGSSTDFFTPSLTSRSRHEL